MLLTFRGHRARRAYAAAQLAELLERMAFTSGSARNPAQGTPVAARLVSGSPAIAPQPGKDIEDESPKCGQVGDIDADGGFTAVPIQVRIGQERGIERIELCQDCSYDDEDAHAENGQ